MDSFEGIIEFVSVAESQGFSSAARQLGVSTSHVSRQVSRLEARLGSALLARTTRMVSLTESGELYYQHCKDLVNGLQQANDQVSREQKKLSGTLRVSAAGTFAENFVAPALMAFAAQHPALAIELDFNSRMANFIEDGIDFAIRYGPLQDSGLVARKLLDRPMVAAASRDYLTLNGTPTHPRDLLNHSCLISNNDHWTFDDAGKSLSIKVQGRWRSNNARAVLNACEEGLGIAYLPKSSFLNALESKRLQRVLEPFYSADTSTWIVYQNRRFLPLRARKAIEFLLQYFEDWEE